jgi:hypothetical protein
VGRNNIIFKERMFNMFKKDDNYGCCDCNITPNEEKESKYLYVTLSERPDRDTIIQDDDILNLIIALNSTNNLEEFFQLA